MSALGRNWRFTVKNATGVALAAGDSITITCRRWKYTSAGALDTEVSEATVVTGGASLANNGFLNGTAQDNSSLGWLGGEFEITGVISTATPNGNLEIYLDRSTDAATSFNGNGLGELIDSLNFTATGTKIKSFKVPR